MQVQNLVGGDVVSLAGRSATFVGRSIHPTYKSLNLVVWRLDNGTISLDALAPTQEVGTVTSGGDGWEDRIIAAMGGE